jgi:NodT family efflux transporter outer membrane factor (OMF) lipoprotein
MMAGFRTTVALASVFLTAGCSTLVPQALRPNDVPKSFTGPVTAGADVWPKPDWWQGFNSTEMSGLIVSAQKDNLDLAVAVANVLQAQAQSNVVRSALFPGVTASGNATRSYSGGGSFEFAGKPVVGSPSTTNSFSATANANYALDIWGLAQDNLQAADEALKSSRFAQENVALTVTASVANAYLDVLALRQEIALTEKNVDDAKRILAITQAKVTNGVSSNLDLAQQQAVVAGQEALIPPLREQEREARFALAILLGQVPEGFDVNAQNLDGIALPTVAPGIPSALMARRPDVAEAEANLASAHANVDAARAAFFPAISLTGSGGSTAFQVSKLFQGPTMSWSVGADMLQTIFDGGKLVGESDVAKAQQLGLVSTYRKTVLTAFSNVETSLGQVSNDGLQEEALDREVKASAEAFRLSELQYREGIIELLNLLQAQQTLFTAENQLIQAKLSRLQADVNLYLALGGGWSENSDDKTQIQTSTTPPPTPTPQDHQWCVLGPVCF